MRRRPKVSIRQIANSLLEGVHKTENFSKYLAAPICAFTPICEEDAGYIPQYLTELERLGVPFAIHLDRCSQNTTDRLVDHPLCIAYSRKDNPLRDFNERDREPSFRACEAIGGRWAWNLDIDETLESGAREILDTLIPLDYDVIRFKQVTLWDSPNQMRVDKGLGEYYREKLVRLGTGISYQFGSKGITNGPRRTGKDLPIVYPELPIACLHWGHMTEALRMRAKARWDRIYTKLVGHNPYGGWRRLFELDELRVEKHQYLKHMRIE